MLPSTHQANTSYHTRCIYRNTLYQLILLIHPQPSPSPPPCRSARAFRRIHSTDRLGQASTAATRRQENSVFRRSHGCGGQANSPQSRRRRGGYVHCFVIPFIRSFDSMPKLISQPISHPISMPYFLTRTLIGKEDAANKQHALLLRAEAVAKEMKRLACLTRHLYLPESYLSLTYSCVIALF